MIRLNAEAIVQFNFIIKKYNMLVKQLREDLSGVTFIFNFYYDSYAQTLQYKYILVPGPLAYHVIKLAFFLVYLLIDPEMSRVSRLQNGASEV